LVEEGQKRKHNKTTTSAITAEFSDTGTPLYRVKTKCYLRAESNTSSDIEGILTPADKLIILEKEGTWKLVKTREGKSAWCGCTLVPVSDAVKKDDYI
jgi:uncharacterized protein YgiM (DUF1202 family)